MGSIDREWGRLWLIQQGCSKLLSLADTVGVDGPMLAQLSRDPELSTDDLQQYPEWVVFKAALRFLDQVLHFDIAAYDQLKELATEHSQVSVLFPFWTMGMLKAYVERNRILADGCELPGCALLFPDLYDTELVMTRVGLDATSEGMRNTFLELIQNLLKQAIDEGRRVRAPLRNARLANQQGQQGHFLEPIRSEAKSELSGELLRQLRSSPAKEIIGAIVGHAEEVHDVIQREVYHLTTGRQTRMQREQTTMEFKSRIRDANKIPSHWEMSAEVTQALDYTTESESFLREVSGELKDAIGTFMQTAWTVANSRNRYKIRKVQQVENFNLWHHYSTKKQVCHFSFIAVSSDVFERNVHCILHER